MPVLLQFSAGSRTPARSRPAPSPCPIRWIFSNYTDALASPSFWRQLANSAMVVAASRATLVVLFSALAAFVFARRVFPGREVAYTLFTLGLLFPSAVAVLPLFVLMRDLGLLDNPIGLALPRPRSACRSRSSSCDRSSGTYRQSWRMPPRSTAAAPSASSGGSSCRSRVRFWRRRGAGRCQLVEPVPLATGDAQTPRRTGRCRWASPTSRLNTRPTRRASLPTRRWPSFLRSPSTSSPSASSSAA